MKSARRNNSSSSTFSTRCRARGRRRDTDRRATTFISCRARGRRRSSRFAFNRRPPRRSLPKNLNAEKFVLSHFPAGPRRRPRDLPRRDSISVMGVLGGGDRIVPNGRVHTNDTARVAAGMVDIVDADARRRADHFAVPSRIFAADLGRGTDRQPVEGLITSRVFSLSLPETGLDSTSSPRSPEDRHGGR